MGIRSAIFGAGEEIGPHESLVGVVEVGEADSDEAIALAGAEVHAVAEGEGDGGELVAGGGRLGGGEAAGEVAELGGFELEDDGAGDAGFFTGGEPDLFGEAADSVGGFVEGEVAFEGVFGGDGLGGAVGDDGAFVAAPGEFAKAAAEKVLL